MKATTGAEVRGASRRRRIVNAVIVAAIGIVIALGIIFSQSGDDDDLAAGDFVGTWESTRGIFIRFDADGSYMASSSVNLLESVQREFGTWSLEGAEFTLLPDVNSPGCAGKTSLYTVERVDDGDAVSWSAVGEGVCLPRDSDLGAGPMRPYTP